jgi:NitT/TauT family transport system substrate-binding protein
VTRGSRRADDEVDPSVAERARALAGGVGWRNPSEKARTRGLSRREFMRESGLASLAAAGVGSTAGCLGGGGGGAPTAEIGYLPITDSAPLLTGYANGHFDDHGVDAAEPTLFRGWSDLAEAFLSGSVNVAHFLMPMTVWMRYGDLDANVQVVAWDHTDGSALTVAPDVETWADLGGRTVAVPFWYSIHNVILQMGLREHGLTPRTGESSGALADDEVTLVVTPPPDMPAALDNGSIGGYIVAEPFNAIGELEADANILRFTGDVWRQHACCVVVMREELLDDHPAWSTDVLRGVVDAQRWLRENRSAAARLLSNADTGLLPQGQEPIDRALTHYDEHEAYTDSGAIQHDWEGERIGFYPYPYRSYTAELVRRLKTTDVEGDAAFVADLSPGEVADDLVTYDPIRTALNDAGGPPAFDVPEDDGYERTEQIQF